MNRGGVEFGTGGGAASIDEREAAGECVESPGYAITARAPQLDGIVRGGKGYQETPAVKQNPTEFARIHTSGDRQDDGERTIRPGTRLTLNYGVRYDIESEPMQSTNGAGRISKPKTRSMEEPISGLQEMRRGALMDHDQDRLQERMENYFDPDRDWQAFSALLPPLADSNSITHSGKVAALLPMSSTNAGCSGFRRWLGLPPNRCFSRV